MADPFAGAVAIAGVGFSPLSRNSGKSVGALALEAGRNAIRDSGLPREAIDGVGGVFSSDQPTVSPAYVAEGLGLPRVTWCYGGFPPSMLPIIEGAAAVYAGICKYALIVHAKYRWASTSADAAADPLRQAPETVWDSGFTYQYNAPYRGTVYGPAAIMQRHMWQYGSRREHFGMIAVSNRTHARTNPRAVFREPLSMAQYLAGPVYHEPFSLYDMDPPIDGAMALVLTRTERARDLPNRPVLIEAMSMGMLPHTELSANFKLETYHDTFKVVADELWGRTGLGPRDMDVMNIYDGFSILAMSWIEACLCGPGNGPAFLEESWDEAAQKLLFWQKIPMSTHGGNLSEGRVQGFGHVNEAALQLRGGAGLNQVPGARLALVTNGIPGSCGGMILSVR